MPSFGAPNRMPTSVSRNKGFTRMPGNSVVLATDKERLKILSVSRTSIPLLLEAVQAGAQVGDLISQCLDLLW